MTDHPTPAPDAPPPTGDIIDAATRLAAAAVALGERHEPDTEREYLAAWDALMAALDDVRADAHAAGYRAALDDVAAEVAQMGGGR